MRWRILWRGLAVGAVGVLVRAAEAEGGEGDGGGMERGGEGNGSCGEVEGEDGRGGGGLCAGAEEVQMFLRFAGGFRLGSKLGAELLNKLVVRFATEKDVAKLALKLGFKDKLPDVIKELIKNEKEIEAVWLACGAGLTGQFPPVPLLKDFLRNFKERANSIMKNGDFSRAATEEARVFELSSVKSIIRCAEENKLEADFDLHVARKRLIHLGKPKMDKRRDSYSKSTRKRGREGRGSGYGFPPSKVKRPQPHWEVRVHPSPLTAYERSYNYPNQGAYVAPPSAQHVSPYGGVQGQSPAALPQRAHGPQKASGIGTGMTYNGAAGYGGYDYGAAPAPSYTPSYQQ